MAVETAQQQQVATQQTIPLPTQEQQVAQGHYGTAPGQVPPRAEGYRPAAIRESRIKDRPYKQMNDSLSIKIELDLEVEVRCLFFPVDFEVEDEKRGKGKGSGGEREGRENKRMKKC
jgi:hypothetical protein